MIVTKVEIIPIRPQNGLVAFACVEINNEFYIRSIGVHKRRDGSGYRITYPTRKAGQQDVVIFHPMTLHLSKEIEQAICKKAEELCF